MKEIASIFKALADETRLRMLGLLVENGELCVCDFIHVLNIKQSKASRHLRYLLNAGLLEDRRDAVWVYYKISTNLNSEQQSILRTLSKSVTGQRIADLKPRLTKWLKGKNPQPACCK